MRQKRLRAKVEGLTASIRPTLDTGEPSGATQSPPDRSSRPAGDQRATP